MKKFFKMLFSRFTLIFLAIALQVVLMVFLSVSFAEYYLPVRIASSVLAFLVLLGIVNRDMHRDGKLPWAILVAMFPITGCILYFAFSRNYATRHERKLFKKLPQKKLADSNPNAPAQFLGQINYLKSVGAPSFSDSETKYFPSGEEFWIDMMDEMEKAEKFIFLEYFIVERGKMLDPILDLLLRKIEQGVEVRMMYDDVGSLPHIRHLFNHKMNKLGINCVRFGKLKPIVSAVYNNRDHRKITVIDGKVGYIGGINLADEYINRTHPFGYWKDTAVKVSGSAVSSLCLMFLQLFDMTKGQIDDFDKYVFAGTEQLLNGADGEAIITEDSQETPDSNETDAQFDNTAVAVEKGAEKTDDDTEEGITAENLGVVTPFGDGPKPFYDDYVAQSVYLNLINQAERSLYITTPYLIVDDSFLDAIKRAAQRGVNVNIVVPKIPDKKLVYAMTKQSCNELITSNVKIYRYTPGFIHAKSIIADGVAGVVGTINLDYRSFVHHYECGVFMYDTPAIRELYNDIRIVLEESEQLFEPIKLKFWEKLSCLFGAIFRPLM